MIAPFKMQLVDALEVKLGWLKRKEGLGISMPTSNFFVARGSCHDLSSRCILDQWLLLQFSALLPEEGRSA